MEFQDQELIRRHVRQDKTLAFLYKEHIDFEKKLAKLDSKLFLTPNEELEKKELQKLKLKGKDRIESILKRYRG